MTRPPEHFALVSAGRTRSYATAFEVSVAGPGRTGRLDLFVEGADTNSLPTGGCLCRKAATASGSGLAPQRSWTLSDSSSMSSSSCDSLSFDHVSGGVFWACLLLAALRGRSGGEAEPSYRGRAGGVAPPPAGTRQALSEQAGRPADPLV